MFGDRAIARNVRTLLSPDLTAPDYFPWGAIKSTVYLDNPKSCREPLPQHHSGQSASAFANMQKRQDACLQTHAHIGSSLKFIFMCSTPLRADYTKCTTKKLCVERKTYILNLNLKFTILLHVSTLYMSSSGRKT
jgi:hypothetical protein